MTKGIGGLHPTSISPIATSSVVSPACSRPWPEPEQEISFNACRKSKEDMILDDIVGKLARLDLRDQVIHDIGSGGGTLGALVMERCAAQGHRLVQMDFGPRC